VLTTPNLSLKKPEANDTVNIADLNYNADILDQEVAKRIVNAGSVPSIQAGPDANKPAPGTAGRLYVATDTQIIYRDTGTAWQKVGAVKWGDIDEKPAAFMPAVHGNEAHDPDLALASDLAAHLAETVQAHGYHDPQDVVINRDKNKVVSIVVLKPNSAGVRRIEATLIYDTAGKLSSVDERVYAEDGTTVQSRAVTTYVRDPNTGQILRAEVRAA
jgi:hypothetical protein